TLLSLLTRADELYALYPPTHPSLSLWHIMGPQSVIYTWSESFSSLPTDIEAEAMVSCPGLIVYPYIGEYEVIEDTASKWEEDKPISKRKRLGGNLKGKVKSKLKRFRRVGVDQTKGMVAGAVIVLGIAMAVYGVQMRDRHPGAGMGLASGTWQKLEEGGGVAWHGGRGGHGEG
ncbi:hypothetical protein C0991_012251, partial [Blastosporella zonata]